MTNYPRFALFSILLCFIVTSCISKKEVLYLQDYESLDNYTLEDYQTILRPDDILYIKVSALDPEAAAPYNPQVLIQGGGAQNLDITQGYLIDKDGFIDFPEFGKLKLGGLNKKEANALITEKLTSVLKNPVVNIRILNYKVTVLGEVNRPGTINISSERITVLDAIGLAGDLTIYGQREVKVIRNENGHVVTGTLDLKSADITKSDFFYLQQNDIVIVDPRNSKIQSAAVGSNTGIFFSIASILLSTIAIIIR